MNPEVPSPYTTSSSSSSHSGSVSIAELGATTRSFMLETNWIWARLIKRNLCYPGPLFMEIKRLTRVEFTRGMLIF